MSLDEEHSRKLVEQLEEIGGEYELGPSDIATILKQGLDALQACGVKIPAATATEIELILSEHGAM